MLILSKLVTQTLDTKYNYSKSQFWWNLQNVGFPGHIIIGMITKPEDKIQWSLYTQYSSRTEQASEITMTPAP